MYQLSTLLHHLLKLPMPILRSRQIRLALAKGHLLLLLLNLYNPKSYTITADLCLGCCSKASCAAASTRTTSKPTPPWARGCVPVRIALAKSSHSRCNGSIQSIYGIVISPFRYETTGSACTSTPLL